jgi:hypothetical protein
MAQEGLAIWHQCIPGGRRQVAQVGKAVKADHDSDSLSEVGSIAKPPRHSIELLFT